MSLLIRPLGDSPIGRWNMFGWKFTKIEAGADGRKRYTMQSAVPPRTSLMMERDCCIGLTIEGFQSRNPATDNQAVEIEGVDQGGVPAIEIDTGNRTITLTYDTHIEASGIWDWARRVAAGEIVQKKGMDIIELDLNSSGGRWAGFDELSRTTYWGVFPIQYQQFTGFGQFEKLKERITLSYDYSELG